ncbi:MAG: S8 family serine peptidase [Planctomycetes bacterium]|nr:S8 family serine peptidase [Planctomycetota bacterium]
MLATGLFVAAKMDAGDDTNKIHSILRGLHDQLERDEYQPHPDGMSRHSNQFLRVNDQGEVQVYVYLQDLDAETLDRLKARGLKVETSYDPGKVVQGWLSFRDFDGLSQLASVRSIRTPDYAMPMTGSVNSEGDAILNANDLRALGFTGSGVKVGVLSDGVDNRQSAINSGDLPAAIEIATGFQGSGDEGTAMLEIIHDLAPGASLAFAGPSTSLDMVNAIRALRNLNCQVIIDDLGFFGEPYFEDGPIAQEVTATVNAGVFYCSAAGNHSDVHYEADFSGLGQRTVAGQNLTNVHDFGNGDFQCRITIPAGTAAVIVLEWSNAFGSSGDDYDLYLFSSDGTQLFGASATQQDGNDSPIEAIQLGTAVADTTADIVIDRFSGSNRRLEFFVLPAGLVQLNEFGVPAGAIIGQQASVAAFATGAISASDPGNDTVETFSSQGPSLIFFPAQVSRNKPEACAIDAVTVTGAGGFPSPFFGTSAAAPHVAAVAALLKSARSSLTPAEITTALQNTAVDINTPGYDLVAGSGRIDALAAFNSLADPSLSSLSFTPNPVAGGASTTGTVTLNGKVLKGNLVVTLQSSDPASAPVPASVTIPTQQQANTFTVQTAEVLALTTVTVSASSGGASVSANLIITVPTLESIAFNPSPVPGGQAATGTITISSPAPSTGLTVTLASSDASTASVPSSVVIPGSATSVTFDVATRQVGLPQKVTITATGGGVTKSGNLEVTVIGGTASGGGGGCFIATAAQGSAFEPGVRALSAFRDARLLPAGMGRDFTATYYAHARPPAVLLRSSASLRALGQRLLRPAFNAVN